MAFYNFTELFQFSVNIQNFIKQLEKSYLGKDAVFKVNYRWLHECVLKWQTKIEESELFDENELEIILPIWILYFHNLLKLANNVDCFKTFLKYALNDINQRQFSFRDDDKNWNILIINDADTLNEFIDEGEFETETNTMKEDSECLSTATEQNLNELYLVKCNFMLDLFVPNRFQYAIFKAVFNPTGTMKIFDKQILPFPYQLQFFTTNFLQPIKRTSIINEDELKLIFLPLQESEEAKQYFAKLNENEDSTSLNAKSSKDYSTAKKLSTRKL